MEQQRITTSAVCEYQTTTAPAFNWKAVKDHPPGVGGQMKRIQEPLPQRTSPPFIN